MSAVRLHRLGLRRRVVLLFGVGALVLCAVSAVATWWLAAGYLQSQRTRIATAEAVESAQLLEAGLRAGTSSGRMLERVTSPAVQGVLLRGSTEVSSAPGLTAASLPGELVAAAREGRAVRQRVLVDDDPRLLVALPLQEPGAVYVAALPLEELDSTLRALAEVLAGAAVGTAVAATGLGAWVSRRALRPLVAVDRAVAAVAAGDLTRRMPTADPDLRPLAETFNETVASLEARVQRDARFAADVSHELRSPLTTIQNAVAVLAARRGDLPTATAPVLDALQADVTRFARIVRDLLEMSVDDGGRPLHLEPVRVAELVRAATAGRTDAVVVTPVAERVVVLAEPRRLERVLANLLDNADAHGGGVVGVSVDADGAAVRIAVDDAGPGVPPDLRPRVFERFHRGAAARTGGDGAGLGLALVDAHVRRHGGQVSVEDRPGGGARFVVRLPVARGEAA